MEWACPWWIFPLDRPTKGEAQIFEWRVLSLQSLELSLKDVKTEEEDEVSKTWMSKLGVVSCWGNVISNSLIRAEVVMGGGVKSSDFIKGDSDRSTRTHDASCTGSGILQEASEGVGMKIAEQDGNSEFK